MLHTPVLTAKVLEFLQPERGGVFVDATTGTGGHSLALLERVSGKIRLISLDQDSQSLEKARQRMALFREKVTFLKGNFRNLKDILAEIGVEKVDGVVYDLGLSSYLLTESGRGFSFQRDEPLCMRYDPAEGQSVQKLLRNLSADPLADILYRYGEIRESRVLARRIKEEEKKHVISTTGELAGIVRKVLRRKGRTDPATRVFQALRIAANNELGNLALSLPQAVNILKPGGRLVVVSYHSLEDRIVKNFLRTNPYLKVITKKVVKPDRPEILDNPASRSARLRAAEKI
ncbi:MAG: 16S rRNA (cytosine(1402)-N(4))-methyltransferase RsmH [Candidatus Omnitrophota bacterium]